MSINYKVKDIQGNITDVEIDKDKTVKDFKAEIEDVLQSENYRRDILKIIYKQSVLEDDQTIESIGAEEDACFSISTIPTYKINFELPKLQTLPNFNLKYNDFLIDQKCTSQDQIKTAICYSEPRLTTNQIHIYTSNWQPIQGPISVTDGMKFGLYIQEENTTPLFFVSQNPSKRLLYAFPSNEPLNTYESTILTDFNLDQCSFTFKNNKFDFSKNADAYQAFGEVTLEPMKSSCSRCLLL